MFKKVVPLLVLVLTLAACNRPLRQGNSTPSETRFRLAITTSP
jgi:hypothetical protein